MLTLTFTLSVPQMLRIVLLVTSLSAQNGRRSRDDRLSLTDLCTEHLQMQDFILSDGCIVSLSSTDHVCREGI